MPKLRGKLTLVLSEVNHLGRTKKAKYIRCFSLPFLVVSEADKGRHFFQA